MDIHCYRHGKNPQADGGGKDTEAPVTLKGVLDTASPTGTVHVGSLVALGIGTLQINSPSDLNRFVKIILAILSHTGFCIVFSTGGRVT